MLRTTFHITQHDFEILRRIKDLLYLAFGKICLKLKSQMFEINDMLQFSSGVYRGHKTISDNAI